MCNALSRRLEMFRAIDNSSIHLAQSCQCIFVLLVKALKYCSELSKALSRLNDL